MINDNDNDTDLWNHVTKTTKKINFNNSLKYHKNIPKKEKKELFYPPKLSLKVFLKQIIKTSILHQYIFLMKIKDLV